MEYHFWDMDHTLVDCDTQVSWKGFLVDEGRVDASERQSAEKFFRDYERSDLDEEAYLRFQLQDFRGRAVSEMAALAKRHFATRVLQRVHAGALKLVRMQVTAGERVLLLTATSRAIALPLAEHFGIPEVLATEFEVKEGLYTGRIAGRYCLGPGKLARLAGYCEAQGISLSAVHYYGDSLPDLHVLKQVGFPVAVNPMPGLLEVARREGWEILDFRAGVKV